MTRTRQYPASQSRDKIGPGRALLLILAGFIAASAAAELWLRLGGYAGDYERELFRFQAPYDTVRRESWALKAPTECLSDTRPQSHPAKYVCVRNRAVRLEPADSAAHTRILFLGDSGTRGWGVADGEAFPEILTVIAKTGAARRDGSLNPLALETINAGVYGFHTVDALRLYRERLSGLRSDAVVLGLFMANDLNYNLLAGELHARGPAAFEAIGAWLRDHSALAHFLRLQLLAVNQRFRIFGGDDRPGSRPAPYTRYSLIDDAGLHLLDYRQGEIAGYRGERDSALMSYAYEVLEQALRDFQTEAAERGAKFGVVLLPAPPMIAGRYVSPIEADIFARMRGLNIELHPGDLEIDRPTERVLALCEKLKIACLHPLPPLRALGLKRALLPDDDHYSREGHLALARAIHPWLRQLLAEREFR